MSRETGLRVGMGAAALALAGTLLFGAWHVVVGGGLHGNPRAAEFGVALAAISAVGLGGLRVIDRRIR
ncbi:MAG TPA: hypothetical protein VFS32_02175 [Candidatus Limnocylindrales bacterium]|nr:hypothetical protein [Candidatus Limnocylindrales bacterium]